MLLEWTSTGVGLAEVTHTFKTNNKTNLEPQVTIDAGSVLQTRNQTICAT